MYDELLEGHSEQTLGRLVGEARECIALPSDLQSRLDEVLRSRNWLVHAFFWDRAGHFITEQGRRFMLEELDAKIKLFESVHNQLHGDRKSVV